MPGVTIWSAAFSMNSTFPKGIGKFKMQLSENLGDSGPEQ